MSFSHWPCLSIRNILWTNKHISLIIYAFYIYESIIFCYDFSILCLFVVWFVYLFVCLFNSASSVFPLSLLHFCETAFLFVFQSFSSVQFFPLGDVIIGITVQSKNGRTVDKLESSWKTVCHSKSQLNLFMSLSITQAFRFFFLCLLLYLIYYCLPIGVYVARVFCMFAWCKCNIITVHLNYKLF